MTPATACGASSTRSGARTPTRCAACRRSCAGCRAASTTASRAASTAAATSPPTCARRPATRSSSTPSASGPSSASWARTSRARAHRSAVWPTRSPSGCAAAEAAVRAATARVAGQAAPAVPTSPTTTSPSSSRPGPGRAGGQGRAGPGRADGQGRRAGPARRAQALLTAILRRYIVTYRQMIYRSNDMSSADFPFDKVARHLRHHFGPEAVPCEPHGPGGPRHRHGGPGHGGGPMFGRGPVFGGRGGRGGPGRGRRRRGDVRAALLRLLSEEPRNGYQLMQAIEELTAGRWSPSPGSVYPALSQLEDEGLIRPAERDGTKVFELTDAGAEQVAELKDTPAPWEQEDSEEADSRRELWSLVPQLILAVKQVQHAGDERQLEQARAVLNDARRALYRVLAGDEGEE